MVMPHAGFAIVTLATLATLGCRRNLDPPEGGGGFQGLAQGLVGRPKAYRIQIIGDFRRPKAGAFKLSGIFAGRGPAHSNYRGFFAGRRPAIFQGLIIVQGLGRNLAPPGGWSRVGPGSLLQSLVRHSLVSPSWGWCSW